MTRNTITLPRSVVEQALEDMEMTISYVQSPTRREDMRDSIDALRAALKQPQDHSEQHLDMVPADWKLVPVEPTKDMKAAGAFAAMDQVRRSYNPPSAYIPVDSMALLSYRAMIAAAPQPPTVKDSLTIRPQVEQEPVAWIEHEWSGSGLRHLHFERPAPTVRDEVVRPVWTPLYLHPQPPRQPLTDDEIEKLFPYTDAWLYEIGLEEATKFARSIEAAHGIGGEA